MKRAIRYLLLSLLLVVVGVEVHAAAYTVEEIPHVQLADRTRYTTNPDGILSEDAVRTIDFVCDTLRTGGYAEVAVVAVREIASDDVFSFAIDLFSEWGVGRAEGDNGLGILLVEGVHEIRFVTGDGLEGVLPDAICKRIQLQYMLPHFREGDYSAGMVAGVEAVARVLEGSEPLPAEEGENPEMWLMLIYFFFPFIALCLLALLRSRCPQCCRRKLQLTDQLTIGHNAFYELVEDVYVCQKCGATVRKRRREYYENNHGGGSMGGPFIGGFGGGSFGGGSMGGGFGGGHFGGGGAGSRW